MINYLLAFLGFILYVVLGIIKTKQKHPRKKFSLKIYLKDEVFAILVSAISAVSLILMFPDIKEIIAPEHSEKIRVISFVTGYLNYALVKGVVNTISPKKFIDLQ